MQGILFTGYTGYKKHISNNRQFFLRALFSALALLGTCFVQAQTKKEVQDDIVNKLNNSSRVRDYCFQNCSDKHYAAWLRKRRAYNFKIIQDTLWFDLENIYMPRRDTESKEHISRCNVLPCTSYLKRSTYRSMVSIPMTAIDTVYPIRGTGAYEIEEEKKLMKDWMITVDIGGEWVNSDPWVISCHTRAVQYYGDASGTENYIVFALWDLEREALVKPFAKLKQLYLRNTK